MRQWSHFGNLLARASGIVFGLAAVNAADSPSASESIALALVAVACVIVVERSFQEHAP